MTIECASAYLSGDGAEQRFQIKLEGRTGCTPIGPFRIC
jgi:hypothetical protein